MRDWWRRWSDSNVGVVISDLRVMVLDVDGPLGEVSLQTLLDQAGSTALPETYTVTTGRADGGRHLWYRLPDQQEKLVSQLGQHYPQTPHLDVLFRGLVVGAGSLHKTGATYVGCSSLPPPPSELVELPMMLFQPLARRGRRRDESGAGTRPADSSERRNSEREWRLRWSKPWNRVGAVVPAVGQRISRSASSG